ncbi:uncharacterized protein LOC141595232 [Silene latifolia]|uniref:uncharacterized protein LOC141595232 n=1 Tax=Silene latifolia TaxID=37657 RepID=UPI003D776D5E
MYVKIEITRLDYFRNNQETIRAELYQGIIDTVGNGECRATNVGKRVILPPTFLGGPRDMKKRYLNSMALVHRFGKPDLFVIMTCNAGWPEIKELLAPGEEVQNRPDLVARVFRAKLLALKKQIVEKQIFGEVAAYVYVVEFQKRGLPHVHFLIILKDGYRLKCPADFDKFVCAEIPTTANPGLRKTVLKHMMHGTCGQVNPDCSCMKHRKTFGKYKYEYPKSFSVTTTTNITGYPEYRRRDTGKTTPIRGHEMDNRWVIPYNPYLLSLFDCHLNVEVCSTMHAVKYLYKYIYKGHDRISFSVTNSNDPKTMDEISQFQSGRWVSPCKAAWRIFGFDLFESHPPVMPLQVHLPNMQTVRLRPTDNLANILADEKKARTPLTEFFRKSATKGCPRLLYAEFTEHFRWDTGTRTWLLLLHIRGPTSFEALKTVKGYTCATFQEAALRHGLLEEQDAFELCMAEACAVQMPAALWRLFSTLLIFSHLKDPCLLWDTHYDSLSEDFRHRYPDQPQEVSQLTARVVEWYLEAMGKTMATFGLDHLDTCNDDEIRRTRDIVDALNAPIPEECKLCKAQLNNAQKEAFTKIMEHVQKSKPGAFFVDGPGGTGKTFLYNALYAEVRLMGKIVLPKTTTSASRKENIPIGDYPFTVVDADNVNPISDLALVAFPELYHSGTFDSNIFTHRAILTPLNEDVDAINSVLIDKFPGEPVTYTSHDSMLDDNCAVYPAEFINKLNPGGMSPHELVLKINCPVILIRNLQPSFGLCNGTRLVYKHFLPNSIECVIMTGQHTGDHVFIPRIKLRPGPSTNYPFQFQRNQFPLKLSFAMTVNKCQGQTLSQVAVYLPRPCFSHGQLYVALSRARKASQVTVFSVPGPEAVPATFVKNVVSYDALSLAEII